MRQLHPNPFLHRSGMYALFMQITAMLRALLQTFEKATSVEIDC